MANKWNTRTGSQHGQGYRSLAEIARADRLAGSACTLNGKPAKVTGRNLDFATVGTLDLSQSFEWSWDATERIMAAGGKFRS